MVLGVGVWINLCTVVLHEEFINNQEELSISSSSSSSPYPAGSGLRSDQREKPKQKKNDLLLINLKSTRRDLFVHHTTQCPRGASGFMDCWLEYFPLWDKVSHTHTHSTGVVSSALTQSSVSERVRPSECELSVTGTHRFLVFM